MNNNIGVVALAVAVMVLAGVFFFKDAPQVVVEQGESLGAFPSAEIASRLTTYSGLAQGGQFTIATTASSKARTKARSRAL